MQASQFLQRLAVVNKDLFIHWRSAADGSRMSLRVSRSLLREARGDSPRLLDRSGDATHGAVRHDAVISGGPAAGAKGGWSR